MYLRAILILMIVVTYQSVTFAQKPIKVALVGTPLSVITPKNIELATWVTSNIPSLNFSLPKSKDGTTPGYPSFSIDQRPKEWKTLNLQGYVDEKKLNKYNSFIIEPKKTKINGREALEIQYQGTTVYDFVGGGAATGAIITHEFVIQDKGVLYTCAMQIFPKGHKKYISTIESLCRSISFSSK